VFRGNIASTATRKKEKVNNDMIGSSARLEKQEHHTVHLKIERVL
jgi:hypothetical protein